MGPSKSICSYLLAKEMAGLELISLGSGLYITLLCFDSFRSMKEDAENKEVEMRGRVIRAG